jgi:ankyrin repeat protein
MDGSNIGSISAPKPSVLSTLFVVCFRTLLARGADINAADRVGNTCTHVAARFGHYQLVATLVAAGADINRRSNKDGALPIQVAAREGHWHCVKLFQTPDGAPVDSAFR